MMLLLLYVDDIILIGNTPSLITNFLQDLGLEFEIKDLRKLHYFLGLEAIYTSTVLHFLNLKYTLDLLHRTNMVDYKPCSTPISTKSQFSSTSRVLRSDLIECCHMISTLQYLTLTRPDISYVVHHAAQFLSTPHQPHLLVAKRILRYLKVTLDFGIQIHRSHSPLQFHAYYDVDWTSCPDAPRSTTSFYVYLRPNLIS